MSTLRNPPRIQESIDRSERNRVSQMALAKDRFESFADSSGAAMLGKDRECRPEKTLPPHALGMRVRGWRVQMSFRREDRKSLREMGWRDVEAKARDGTVPEKLVMTENHIITAVRELIHIQEGYEREAGERIDRELSPMVRIMEMKLAMYARGQEASDEEIRAAISALKGLKAELGRKRSAVKSIISCGRLEQAISKFESILESPRARRGFMLGSACAVLDSADRRLSEWRDRAVARASSKARARAASLRLERDKWLFSQLTRFANATEAAAKFSEIDRRKMEVLESVERLLAEARPFAMRMRALGRASTWSDDDERALSEKKSAIEAMRAEVSRCPWFDKKARSGALKLVRRLERRRMRSREEEMALEEAHRWLESAKAEAMRLPGSDPEARSTLLKAVKSLEARRSRAAKASAELAEMKKAYDSKRTEAMRCIWANAAALYETRDGKKPTVLRGDYGWLHRHIKEGRLGMAAGKLSELKLFLSSNKPDFILAEISKMPEPYLAPVLAELAPAVEAFLGKDLINARKHFSRAALLMRTLVYPAEK